MKPSPLQNSFGRPGSRPRTSALAPAASLPAALLPAALLLLALLIQPAALWAAAAPGQWTLADDGGQRWVVSLFQQPDPAYPEGPRLRVTRLTPAPGAEHAPSHSAALELRDAFGGQWRLANRSEELVPPAAPGSPAGSAQFGLDALPSAPRDEGPVLLGIPLDNGERAGVVLGPAPSAALRALLEPG